MKFDIYLNFLYKIIKNNLIYEKTQICDFLKNKVILKNQRELKNLSCNFFVCEVDFGKDKVLILEDLALNFLLSYTILVGKNTKIISFKTLDNLNKTYFLEEKLFNKIKDLKEFDYKINFNSINNCFGEDLFGFEFRLNYNLPKFVFEIRNYLSEIKNINFSKIHVVDSIGIENFVPTVKNSHLKIAKSMNLPILSLIENNFIKESTINIYDENNLKKIICPKIIYLKNIYFNVYKKNNLKLFKDIDKQYYLIFDKKKIINLIENVKIFNFDKKKLIDSVLSYKDIKLSTNFGEFCLPIFKSKKTLDFVKIKDTNDFFQITGVEFENNFKKLQNVYIQDLKSNQANFVNKYLNFNLEKTFESLEKTENIFFHNKKDLILKIIFNNYFEKLNLKKIIKIEEFNENQINQLKNITNSITKKIIFQIVSKNKIPKILDNFSNLDLNQKYLLNLFYKIENIQLNYKNFPNKKILFKEILNILNNIKFIFKNLKILDKQMYLIILNYIKLIKICKIINSKIYDENLKNLEEFIKIKNFQKIIKTQKFDFNFYQNFNDYLKILNFAKKNKILIFIKSNSEIFFKNNFINNSNIQIIDKINKNQIIIKPNKKNIKKIFKYSQNKIIEQIKKLDYNQINNFKIDFKGKKIPIKQEFISYYFKIENHKKILENNKIICYIKI